METHRISIHNTSFKKVLRIEILWVLTVDGNIIQD